MPNIDKNPYIKELIYKWNIRLKKLGMTQEQLAKEVGLNPKHLSRIMNMHIKNPRDKTINDIEMFLNGLGV